MNRDAVYMNVLVYSNFSINLDDHLVMRIILYIAQCYLIYEHNSFVIYYLPPVMPTSMNSSFNALMFQYYV